MDRKASLNMAAALSAFSLSNAGRGKRRRSKPRKISTTQKKHTHSKQNQRIQRQITNKQLDYTASGQDLKGDV